MSKRIDGLLRICDSVWLVVCTVMVILAQVGFLMREVGSIKMYRNTVVQIKTILVISMSSLTFFAAGYGFSSEANGGIVG